MKLLSLAKAGREFRPPRLLVYGQEGVGKSSLAAKAPAPIFLPTEDGLHQIDVAKLPLLRSFDEMQAALGELLVEPHDYHSVVIDSLDWLERLIWDDLCHKYGATSIDKVDGGYAHGYTHAVGYWRKLLDILSQLHTDRGMAVLLVAHSKVEKFEDPESSPYDRYSPRLHKHAASLITEWCDAVLFATWRIRTQTEEAGFNRKRTTAHAIGKDGGDRILRTVGGPSCVAKNRYGLDSELPLDWQAVMDGIARCQS